MSLFLQFLDESRTAMPKWALMVAFLACVVSVFYTLYKGEDLSKAFGLYGVALHCAVATYVLATAPYLIQATALLQEMPLMAMYLAWFYPKPIARWALAGYLLGTLGFAFIGEGRYLNEAGTVHEMIRVTIFMSLCMELGFLWRGRERAAFQVDPLTGAVTREGFDLRFRKELDRANRHNTPLSLAIIDLDNFKEVNDSQGHDAGDRVLRNIVAEISAQTRQTDVLFRFGGDEFVLLLPHTSEDAAHKLLARLREESTHPWSSGVAQATRGDSAESMLLRADKEMYTNKRRAQEQN